MHRKKSMQGFSISSFETTKQFNYMTAINISLVFLSDAKSANAIEFKNKIIDQLIDKIRSYSDDYGLVEYQGYGRVRILVKDKKDSQAVEKLYNRLIFELNSPVMIGGCLVSSRACISVEEISEDCIDISADSKINNPGALYAREYGAGCPDFFDVYIV